MRAYRAKNREHLKIRQRAYTARKKAELAALKVELAALKGLASVSHLVLNLTHDLRAQQAGRPGSCSS